MAPTKIIALSVVMAFLFAKSWTCYDKVIPQGEIHELLLQRGCHSMQRDELANEGFVAAVRDDGALVLNWLTHGAIGRSVPANNEDLCEGSRDYASVFGSAGNETVHVVPMFKNGIPKYKLSTYLDLCLNLSYEDSARERFMEFVKLYCGYEHNIH